MAIAAMGKRKNRGNKSTKSCCKDDNTPICRHVNQSVDLEQVKKALMVVKRDEPFCDCVHCENRSTEELEANSQFASKNSLCLRCGNQACSRLQSIHSLQHFVTPGSDSHALCVDTNTWKVWCYDCRYFVCVTCNMKLSEIIRCLQRQVKLLENTDEDVLPSDMSPEKIDDMLLSELECPVCYDYIIPPIYQCVTGHNICGECKGKIADCPICKFEIRSTRNFALEKMASLLNYPCKFTGLGCDFACKPRQIREHQMSCVHGPRTCPLKDYVDCEWIDSVKNIYKHLLEDHKNNVLETKIGRHLITIFLLGNYLGEQHCACYVMKFADRLFKLHYLYKSNVFYWAMQLIGPTEDAKKYKFEIEINDESKSGRSMLYIGPCAPLTEKNQSFESAGTYICIHLDQIRLFLTNFFSYKVSIFD